MNREKTVNFLNSKILSDILWIAVWCPWIIFFIIYAVSLLGYPYEWEPGEGSKILYAQQLLDGKSMYSSNNTFPMLGNCYPPVYPLLIAPLIYLFGPHLCIGRIISILAVILSCFFVWLIIRTVTRSKKLAFVACACMLFPSPIVSWYPLTRMDALCTFFQILCGYIIFKKTESLKFAVFAGLCAVAGLFTKQTAVFSAVLFIFYYLINKKWKQAGIYLLTISAVSLILFFIFQISSHGWFYKNLISENTQRVFFMKRYKLFFGWIFSYSPVIWIVAIFAIIKQFITKNINISLLIFTAGLINALLIGANGSGMNYFFTFWAGMSLLFVEGLFYLELWIDKKFSFKIPKSLLTSILIFLISLSFINDKFGFFYRNNILGYIPAKEDYQAMKKLESYIKSAEPPIFVDRFPSIAMKYEKNQFYMEPALIQELHNSKLWNPSPAVNLIKNKKFKKIFLLTDSLIPYPMKKAIQENYAIAEKIKIGTFEIFRNRFILVMRPKQ